jgi:anaerobic selenocysteine-containing dehydrogenase
MQFSARLVELGHPSKIWLLEEIVKLNPSHLMAYQQLGISHYHDSSFAQARAVWAAGLDKRDELAQQSGLAQSPFRLLDASWYQAVGHIALLDTFIKARKLGWLEEKPLYLLRVAGRSTVNQSYLDYWQSYVEMPKPDAEGDNLAETARITGLKLKQFSQVTEPLWATKRSDGKTLWHMEFAAAVQREWESRGGAPLLTLNEQDDAFGPGHSCRARHARGRLVRMLPCSRAGVLVEVESACMHRRAMPTSKPTCRRCRRSLRAAAGCYGWGTPA